MAVFSLEGAKGCGSADNRLIGRCDGGCLLLPVVPPSFSLEVPYAIRSGDVSAFGFPGRSVHAVQDHVVRFPCWLRFLYLFSSSASLSSLFSVLPRVLLGVSRDFRISCRSRQCCSFRCRLSAYSRLVSLGYRLDLRGHVAL